MKNILLLFLLLYPSFLCSSKTFKIGVIFVMNDFVKIDMKIDVNDSLVIFSSPNKPATTYKKIKESNGTIYYTDGVMTNLITVANEIGKKKGFNYNRLMVCIPDYRLGAQKLLFYAMQDSIH
jgi:hypothetical protein